MRGSNVGDVNELLLVSDDGAILEGSQTNFFAIEPAGAGKPSHVRTAGDGVLEGTVRRLLLEVCEREGIPVKLASFVSSGVYRVSRSGVWRICDHNTQNEARRASAL